MQTHGTDTGSVLRSKDRAMLSARVVQLTGHLQQNKHDFSSRQGLLKMIGRRKRLARLPPPPERGALQPVDRQARHPG